MCLKEKETISPPYSYHTFIFPFVWSGMKGKKQSRKKFAKYISKNWELIPIKETDISGNDLVYNQYQYFNAASRSAVFTELKDKVNDYNDAIVWNYEYIFPKTVETKSESADELYHYVIKKDDFEARLKIERIRLKLFESDIGVIIFELENHQDSSEDFVNKVNDYGRRIFMPFSDKKTCSSCAKYINIKAAFSTKEYLESEVCNRVKSPLKHSIAYMLLFDSKKDITIEPIIDDRMFVACYYKNSAFINELKEWEKGEYSYLSSAINELPGDTQNLANRLYRYVFVDAKDISCYSRTLLEDMLKKHIYHRWIELGTISGISEYSMVSLTTNDPPPHLAPAFLTEYVEMAIIALAQRASLLNFEKRLSECACGNQSIESVHKEYLLFQSQLLLSEVTPQQQGIELYNMLLENLFIEKQARDIEKQIQSLYAHQTAKNEKRENLILFIIAVIGVIGAIEQFCDWFMPDFHKWRFLAFLLTILVLGFAYFRNRRK